MRIKTGLFLLCLFSTCCIHAQAQKIRLKKGLIITRTVQIKSGNYSLASESPEAPVLVVEGDNIILDFGNTQVRGDQQGQLPNTYSGLGILVRNSKRVTIRNLRVRGFKVGLMAVNVQNLVLENCDFSYNYRQRLNSTALKEDLSDWMSYHQNEKDEWLRYGAGMYLRGCDSMRIENCRVTGGQNALMMTDCQAGKIINNDFSFNSGIGIGLYRSSQHLIAYNRVNFNVRGYSHGVYHRGQDSAGFLVYEQSSNNTFYKNSATHSGDGFFLWAGQSTMDTGKGGCNDNLIAGNDFSYAPTNGVEVTFSRNIITRNRIFGCDHGIWGGYSYESLITDNQFRDNRIAIAIEHGQQNSIAYNLFIRDKEAIRLWARASQPADWGYARYRDTRSVGYNIHHNSFSDVPLGLNLSRTDSLRVFSNAWTGEGLFYQTDSLVGYIDSMTYDVDDWDIPMPEMENVQDPFVGAGKWAGRQQIRMGEWGPYDFRRPLIWHSNPASKSDTLWFDMLAPGGQWTLTGSRGLSQISQVKGSFPASFYAIREKGMGRDDMALEAVYRGPAITLADGTRIRKGKKHRFHFQHFFQPINWQVNWFAIDTTLYNPIREQDLFPANQRLAPIKSELTDRLEYAWWGGIKMEKGTQPQFLTMAEGEAELPEGEYELSVTWDDAVRLYVDNKLVLDEWNPALYKFDESPNRRIPIRLGGKHQFRVEHVELGGFATLNVRIVKREP